ncbi:Elongator complex protein 1 [Orchesella cincta]|uniref:Elongator complex protein 1 n=1 Tax=Orchesella cincta TaxID=48709 RepID=A0A1D2MGF8_ORCCI|nr:Elongator complex protein 1 [Orchesella cincta]
MRNLKIIQKRKKTGSLFPAGGTNGPEIYCLGDHGYLYFCRKGVLSRYSLEESRDVEILCESQDMLGDVVQMQYVASTGIIYLRNDRGSFLQFMVHDNEVVELFQSDQGIAYFSVSPDSRCVAIVTMQKTLLLLTLPDLETLTQEDLVEAVDSKTDGAENGAMSVKVVWREDSHYFAVNYQHAEKFHIKIFDENGTFHAKTEDENVLLDSTLEWQPSGGLIAAVGKTPHGTVVSLFERNGLKRADFFPYEGKKDMYEDNKVTDLQWNTSSDIFAIRYDSKVEIWCRNNYVWMRKLILVGPVDNPQTSTKLIFTAWERERSNRLHIVDESGAYAVYDLAFTYTAGYSDGSSLVASWNGNGIHCTPFRNSCCPPPHCLFQVNSETDIKAVIIPEFWNGLLSVCLNGDFTFWKYDSDGLKQIRKISVPDFNQYAESYDWLWPTRNSLCCLVNGTLAVFEIQNGDFEDTSQDIIITAKTMMSLNHNVTSAFLLVKNKEDSNILIQSQKGLVFKLDLSAEDSIPVCKFPQVCTHFQTINDTVVVGHDPLTRKLMIGWSKYPDCDPVVISNDCTSFTVFQNSLIYTTIQGSLEIRNEVYVTKLLEKHFLGNEFSNEEESQGRYTRKCEKGSQIVTCCLNQMLEPSLVLQIIPRGNLEIIYPRPLVITNVKVLMREKENNIRYEKIMSALRRHRIDYRILIDEMKVLVNEQPDCRLEELLKTMVEQVKDSHSLVLLVTDLNQDYADCILTIKIILEGVLESNKDSRMLHVEESYLASLAKLGLLEEALKSTLILGESENNRELVQHRVKFLSFYCDNPDTLFDTALGTYDLVLASLVADCLGKDPKEYIPILDGFKSMLWWKRHFKIDDKLRRYSKAVISLVRDQRVQHDEIVKYMERHRLFTDVITFLTRKLKHDEGGMVERSGDDTGLLLREAQSSYAHYLEERGKLTEASILFRDAEKLDKSVECCVKSGDWEFALEVAYQAQSSEDKIKEICKEILNQLEEKKMYSDAARLCETYLCDIQQAVHFWLKDKKWQKASVLAMKLPELGKNFRDEHIRNQLLDTCTEQMEGVGHTLEDITMKLQRLRKVKEIKAERLLETGGMGDAFSDTESYLSGSSTSGSISSSNISGKSYRSGKNKRKLERKLYSLKEGSKYEDLALIVHLWMVVDKIQQETKQEVANTIESLWKFNQQENAISLCSLLEKLLLDADKCVQEVWSAPITDDILEVKFRIPPVAWTPLWSKLALHEPSSKATTR